MTLQNIITNKKFLFIDRDGVINERIWNGYVTKWEDFHFVDGVIDALVHFSKIFQRIIIITNQQGIGKGMMSVDALNDIHQKLVQKISEEGGKIDAVFYCGDLKSKENNCRKPGTKMAEQAKIEFPEINFSESLMIGDTKSDMEFAKNVGMTGVLVETQLSTPSDLESSKYIINTLDDIVKLLK
jgi:histidinol-phosphate phosphatase family protein